MKLSSLVVTILMVGFCLTFSEATPITDQDLESIRQFAAAAMAKGRQLLRPRHHVHSDNQGAFSHYYGRHIPSVNLLPVPPNNKPDQFFKVHAASAAAPVVLAPAPKQQQAAPVVTASAPATQTPPQPSAPATPDPFRTFEQHMFPSSSAQSSRSQFNHHSFGPFHFFTNKSPPPPPRGPPPPPHIRHSQQLQAVMSGQHLATVVQQSGIRDQQQGVINAQFLPFGLGGKATQYFGKFGLKPHPQALPPHTFQRPIGDNFIPQNRPNDDLTIIQSHLQPQEYSFTQLPGGKEPLTVGPETNPFNLPFRFEQVQQIPYAFPVQPQPLHLAMVVQNQEFPQYQFNPNLNFVDPSTGALIQSQNPPNPQNSGEAVSTTLATTSDGQTTVSSGKKNLDFTAKEYSQNGSDEAVGDVIFESVRHTQQQQQREQNPQVSYTPRGRGQKQENVVYPAPLVFSQELFPTVTPSSTVVASSSSPTTTEENTTTTAQQVAIEFFKAKEVPGGKTGAVVTPSTSTSFISSSSKSVSSSMSTAVGPHKVKRLRKVKVSRQGQNAGDKFKANPPKSA